MTNDSTWLFLKQQNLLMNNFFEANYRLNTPKSTVHNYMTQNDFSAFTHAQQTVLKISELLITYATTPRILLAANIFVNLFEKKLETQHELHQI